jgi:serine phosphatase RsbU (regulator of sigma subunit)/ligand-binding sensor protein
MTERNESSPSTSGISVPGESQSARRSPGENAGEEAGRDITDVLVPQIRDMIEAGLLQQFQNTFADALGVSVLIRDAEGKRLTQPSEPNRFCSLMVKTLGHDERHEEGSIALSLKAMRSGRIEEARSAQGFVQFAAPVTIQGRAAGALVVGEVPDEKTDARTLEEMGRRMELSPEEMRPRSAEDLAFALSLLQFAANALADLCHEGWVIRRHVSELHTLQNVSQLLNSTRQVNDVLRLVVRTICETLDVKACGLRLLDAATGQLVLKAVHGLSPQYLSKGPVPMDRSEIDKAAMEGGPVYVADLAADPRILYPAEMLKEGIRSILVVGLKVQGRPLGALRIYAEGKRRFHRSELALTDALANLSAIAIENAKLYEEALEKERLEYELGLAAQIQAHLLPTECPRLEGFDIAALNEPCRQVGGDFFDFIPEAGGRRWGVVIADVCGKSMGAALLMATARSALRVQSEHCTTPAEIVTRVNISLCRDTRPEEFVTLFLGKLDTRTRVLHYANAGHNRPVLYHADRTSQLESSGMVCGVLADNTYHESDVQLESGDILLLYTDGLNEARNPDHGFFGLERTRRVILDNRERPAAEIVAMLRDEVRKFADSREQSDDLTLVLIKVK